jgi:hypothetical protein
MFVCVNNGRSVFRINHTYQLVPTVLSLTRIDQTTKCILSLCISMNGVNESVKAWYWTLHGNGLLVSLCRFYILWTFSVCREGLSHWTHASFGLSIKRVIILGFLFWFIPHLIVWNHIGFWLDDLFFPDWKNTEIEKPLFLVGNARSGTTWLHRVLIESDSTVFTSFKTWEILFAASISWRCLFFKIVQVDREWFCGCGIGVLTVLDRFMLGDIQIHPVGLFHAEEDEWLMIHTGNAQLLLLLFPTCGDLMDPLIRFDSPSIPAIGSVTTDLSTNHQSASLSLAHRFAIFEYYRSCVQRHMYFYSEVCNNRANRTHIDKHNNQKLIFKYQQPTMQFVSKNPTFTLRLITLQAVFPDCRLCVVVRNPINAVPSMVSYISHCWKLFSSPVTTATSTTPQESLFEVNSFIGFCELHYLFPLSLCPNGALTTNSSSRFAQSRWAFASYEGAQRSLTKEMEEILKTLGIWGQLQEFGRDSCVKDSLMSEELLSKSFVSNHKVITSAHPQLTPTALRERFSTVLRIHGHHFDHQMM